MDRSDAVGYITGFVASRVHTEGRPCTNADCTTCKVLRTIAAELAPPRAGDRVYHRPTAEVWIVLACNPRTGNLTPCGWPPTMAYLTDCVVVERCGDDEHVRYVTEARRGSIGHATEISRAHTCDACTPEAIEAAHAEWNERERQRDAVEDAARDVSNIPTTDDR